MKLNRHLLIVAIVLLVTGANCAWASHGGGHGGSFGGHSGFSSGHHDSGGYGGWHGGGWGNGGRPYRGWYGGWYGGLWLDPWAYDYWPGYAIGDPEVIVPSVSAPTYIETAPATNVPQSGGSDWYYCQNPAGYYPYVRNCSVQWQRVPSKPPAMQ